MKIFTSPETTVMYVFGLFFWCISKNVKTAETIGKLKTFCRSIQSGRKFRKLFSYIINDKSCGMKATLKLKLLLEEWARSAMKAWCINVIRLVLGSIVYLFLFLANF